MADGATPLHMAAFKGYFEICKLILENVDDKNPSRNDGTTPLYMAAQFGHYKISAFFKSRNNYSWKDGPKLNSDERDGRWGCRR